MRGAAAGASLFAKDAEGYQSTEQKQMPRQRTYYSRRTYEFPDDFPQRLERFKEESGLTWADINRHLGAHDQTTRRWRKGHARPSTPHMMALLNMAGSLGLRHIFSD